ncbi:BnaC04g53470D [Brassica napus]|uniref:BnaC04g53470D protein n=1 Tax=Brassica napus TaxID=3708 RepID=A0A078J1L7_BRANA|nr:BnaC04g53470D [Brassica napus]
MFVDMRRAKGFG